MVSRIVKGSAIRYSMLQKASLIGGYHVIVSRTTEAIPSWQIILTGVLARASNPLIYLIVKHETNPILLIIYNHSSLPINLKTPCLAKNNNFKKLIIINTIVLMTAV